jgi:hypothetical protein
MGHRISMCCVCCILAIFLSGCEPTLDISSLEALEKSGPKVVEKLDSEQKVLYDEAVSFYINTGADQVGGLDVVDSLERSKREKAVLWKAS